MAAASPTSKRARTRTADDAGLTRREDIGKETWTDGTGPMPVADAETLARRAAQRPFLRARLPPPPAGAAFLPPTSPAATPVSSPAKFTPPSGPVGPPNFAPPSLPATPTAAPSSPPAAAMHHLLLQEQARAAAEAAQVERRAALALSAAQQGAAAAAQRQLLAACVAAQQQQQRAAQAAAQAQAAAAAQSPRGRCSQRHLSIMSHFVSKIMEWDHSLLDVFKDIDKDRNGVVTAAELELAMQQTGISLTRAELKEIGATYDRNQDGGISVQEFVAMACDFNAKLQERFKINTGGAVPVSWTGSTHICPSNITRELRSAMLQILSRLWQYDAHVSVAFAEFDEDRSGRITLLELHRGLHKLGAEVHLESLVGLARCYGRDFQSGLDPNEFVALLVDFNQALQQRFGWNVGTEGERHVELAQRTLLRCLESNTNLVDLFAHFDTNGDGLLTLTELARGLQWLGVGVGLDEATNILGAHDSDGSGTLDVNEFITMIAGWNEKLQERFRSNVLRGEVASPGKAAQLPTELHRVLREIVFRCMSINRPLTEVFTEIPRTSQFVLNADELALGLTRLGVSVSMEEVVKLGCVYDEDGNGKLDIGEFQRMIIDMNTFLQNTFRWNLLSIEQRRSNVVERIVQFIEERGGGMGNLVNIFHMVDQDRNNKLSASEFALWLGMMGVNIPVAEMRMLFVNADRSGDGSIQMHEFCELIASLRARAEQLMAMHTD